MTSKVIAITGASSGIGEATARLLSASGHKLVLGARRTAQLTAIVEDIRARGGAAVSCELDVTDRASAKAFVEFAVSEFERLDVMVNNAGVMYLAPIADLRVDEWDRMVDVNVKGLLNSAGAAFAQMQAQQAGHLITIGSVVGHQVGPGNGVYAATKFAARAVAEAFRLEGGVVRSTLISPGAVSTELFDKIPHPQIQEMAKARLDNALSAGVIAEAIAFAIGQPDNVDVSEIIVRPMGIKT